MEFCEKTDCGAPTAGGLALRVPAMNCPIPEHDPIKMVFGLRLCDRCFGEAKAEDFLSEQLKAVVRIQARGKAEPDFKRAFLELVDFDSPEWIALTKNRKKD